MYSRYSKRISPMTIGRASGTRQVHERTSLMRASVIGALPRRACHDVVEHDSRLGSLARLRGGDRLRDVLLDPLPDDLDRTLVQDAALDEPALVERDRVARLPLLELASDAVLRGVATGMAGVPVRLHLDERRTLPRAGLRHRLGHRRKRCVEILTVDDPPVHRV